MPDQIGRKNSAGGGSAGNNYGTYYNAITYNVLYDTGSSSVGNIGGICTTTNDVALFCIDATNNKVWMGRSRSGTVTWLGGGDPSTGTSPTFSGSGGGGGARGGVGVTANAAPGASGIIMIRYKTAGTI